VMAGGAGSGEAGGRPARRDMIDTTRIGDLPAQARSHFPAGAEDDQPPDISSSNGLKWRSPIFGQPEAIGPQDQWHWRNTC
jgi:hypothetical protein